MSIMDMSYLKQSSQPRYALTVIDIFSTFGGVQPNDNKDRFTLASRPSASPALTVLLVRGNLFTAKAMSPCARVG